MSFEALAVQLPPTRYPSLPISHGKRTTITRMELWKGEALSREHCEGAGGECPELTNSSVRTTSCSTATDRVNTTAPITHALSGFVATAVRCRIHMSIFAWRPDETASERPREVL